VSKTVSILVKREDGRIASFSLEEGENLIGRWDPDARAYPEIDLTEADPEMKVSRKHATLIVEDDHVILSDIGSRNGTYLKDGTKVEEGNRVKLGDQDEFIVGKTCCRISLG
jgi:predicted component of type VI protein secretion system